MRAGLYVDFTDRARTIPALEIVPFVSDAQMVQNDLQGLGQKTAQWSVLWEVRGAIGHALPTARSIGLLFGPILVGRFGPRALQLSRRTLSLFRG